MSPQYGELWPTSGWDPFGSLGHPSYFQRLPRLGSVTARHLVVGVSQTLRRWTEGATYVRQGHHHVGHWPTFPVTTVTLKIKQCNGRWRLVGLIRTMKMLKNYNWRLSTNHTRSMRESADRPIGRCIINPLPYKTRRRRSGTRHRGTNTMGPILWLHNRPFVPRVADQCRELP